MQTLFPASARLWLAIVLAGLVACSEELPPEPAAPLIATEEQLQQLYKWGPGPHAVSVVSDLEIPLPGQAENLRFSVWYPQAGASAADAFEAESDRGSVPVLLFSHGNWSDNSKYDNLLYHWVSHGYAVIAPVHRDGGGGYLAGTLDLVRHGNFGLIKLRVKDLEALLNALPEITDKVPELIGRLDASRIAATGHSFGAFNAQQLGGAQAFDTDREMYVSMLDDRIKAVVAISPPGPMFDQITADSWKQQRLPTLMTTGTWDTNAMFWPDWRAHKTSFDTAIPGDQFALVVQGADHYLGNLICRPELEAPPQHDALAMVNTAVVAFLDAWLLGDAQAMAFIQSDKFAQLTGGFAVMEQR